MKQKAVVVRSDYTKGLDKLLEDGWKVVSVTANYIGVASPNFPAEKKGEWLVIVEK